MYILAIDTSCDETSVAISENDKLLANVLYSQISIHKEWGGVVPLVARRNHIERIDSVIEKALKQARLQIEQIDVFAVTYGPGLAVALEVGVSKIKELTIKYKKKLIAVNHMSGHIYANFAKNRNSISYGLPSEKVENPFPLLALLISGGHTEIVLMKEHCKYEIVGQTLDDSVGEAFDKVSRMLMWGYPGGPIIEEFAKMGNADKFNFPIPMRGSGDLNFSYSGLKTAVLQTVQKVGQIGPSAYEKYMEENKDDERTEGKTFEYSPTLSKQPTFNVDRQTSLDIAASFQKAAVEELVIKIVKAAKQYSVNTVILGGGVVNNALARSAIRNALRKIDVMMHYPKNKKLLSDNAGMIAIAAYYMAKAGKFINPETIDRNPSVTLDEETLI